MPPRSTATSRIPASASEAAACDDRLSVRQTTITGPVSRPISGIWRGSSGERHVARALDMPERPVELVRTAHVEDQRMLAATEPVAQFAGLDPHRLDPDRTRLLAAEQPPEPPRHRACLSSDRAHVSSADRAARSRSVASCVAGEPHLRRLAGVERLLPARRAQAPAIAGLQPGKAGGRKRGRQIVAGRFRERQELGIDPGADRMHAEILGAGLAAAGAIKPGQRLGAAFGERLAEDVARPVGAGRGSEPEASGTSVSCVVSVSSGGDGGGRRGAPRSRPRS